MHAVFSPYGKWNFCRLLLYANVLRINGLIEMAAGAQAHENASGLSHIERIKVPRKGNFHKDVAAFDNPGTQAVVLVAQNQDCGQRPDKLESVENGISILPAGCAHYGKALFIGSIQAAGKIGHNAQGQARNGSRRGARHTSVGQSGRIVFWEQHATRAESPCRAGQGAHIPCILHLIKGEKERKRSLGEELPHGFERVERDRRQMGDNALGALPGIAAGDFGKFLFGEKFGGDGIFFSKLNYRSKALFVFFAKDFQNSVGILSKHLQNGLETGKIAYFGHIKIPVMEVKMGTRHGKARLAILVVLALFISACGAKNQSVEEPKLTLVLPADTSGHDLNSSEMAALQSTGQIDKNVPSHAMDDIAAQYKYFLRKGRNTMCVFSRRSEQYLAYARKVFRERGMPEDLAYLAIVESGYRPNAVSHAGAAGAWQFMPETGQRYGLKQDFWQDERLDPYRATEAAADYLQKLHNDFGDWPTAIAAYNAGEGKISRAKAGTGGKDFYEVNVRNHLLDEKAQLRTETRQYVPRFMAVTKIMRNLPQLGFDPIKPENAEPVARVTAKPGTDLRAFSKACNMSWKEFNEYNRHHKRSITCTDRNTFVYVPSRVQKLANDFVCTAQTPSYAGWKPITVASSHDSLAKISSRSNIPLAKLQAANPDAGSLKAGQIILVPTGVKMLAAAPKTSGKASKSAHGRTHILKSGETLFALSKKYNTTVDAIKAHNGIDRASSLKTGLALVIPGGKLDATPAKGSSSGKLGRRSTYTVQLKDNLWSIARRHKISVDDLRRWNNIPDRGLRPGTTLVVSK